MNNIDVSRRLLQQQIKLKEGQLNLWTLGLKSQLAKSSNNHT